MTYREIAETFQDLIWHQLQTMLDSSHEGAAWAYPRPRSASLSMSNQTGQELRSSFSGTYERLTTPQG